MSLRTATRQSQLRHIELILDAAQQKAQPRQELPGKIATLPIVRRGKVKRLLLKGYNFLFKEQRTAQSNTIQALRELASLQRQMLEQSNALEIFQQSLQTAVNNRLDDLTQRCARLEHLLEQQPALPENLALSDRLNQLATDLHQLEIDHNARLRQIQMDLVQQNRPPAPVLSATPSPAGSPPHASTANTAPVALLDRFYSAFEDEFRGDRELIRRRLLHYIPLINAAALSPTAPVLDIGCGRGEWLEILQENRYSAIGIDLNDAMLAQCQAAGLSVQKADALSYLQAQPDNSLGAVTGFHIVEHLPFADLVHLMTEAFRVIQPGGFVLFETPNPRNVTVGSCSFYIDPTHRNPIPPEVLQFLARYSGFSEVTPLWLNPADQPKLVEDSELAKRFNQLFYGCMDYAVMGLK